MTGSLKFEAHYRHPPEAVWRVLTDSQIIARWLMPNDFRPELGAEFQFRAKPMGGWDGIAHCKVIALEPPRVLSYTWKSNVIDTVVHFELRASSAGTHLTLVHSGFGKRLNARMAKFFMGLGWRGKVRKEIPALLAELTTV